MLQRSGIKSRACFLHMQEPQRQLLSRELQPVANEKTCENAQRPTSPVLLIGNNRALEIASTLPEKIGTGR